jgi:hypothetical protein
MDAHCLSIGIHAEIHTWINKISSLNSYFGEVSAGLWYIKHECDRYPSTKFPNSLAPIL